MRFWPGRWLLCGMRRYRLAALAGVILLITVTVAADRLWPPPLPAPPSSVVLDGRGELLRGFLTATGTWRLPVRPEAVSPVYLRILKAYEDRRFDWHPGVDLLAVLRALGQWLGNGRIVSGASTLTMQTARLLEPRPRTLPHKALEMLRALQLEWRYDKNEILALYLTLAPFGGNLEGVRAASLAYLGKEPAHLTAAEAALLVALPQAPSRLRPDRYPKRARQARDKVLRRMENLGVLSPRQVAEALQEASPESRYTLPFRAPHLARRLHGRDPKRTVHRTFVDGDLQHKLEALARRARLDPQANLGFLVVENAGRRVRGYVGSADFFAAERAGQVDMLGAVRSPGSTLKPLIYSLAFDDLLLHPETLINDAPTRFGDYRPANFLHRYRGQTSVREALQRSLNVPAVAILEALGPRRVAAKFQAAGVTLQWQGTRQEPGLPLALGGVGTTLEDLVTLYAALADGGRFRPLRLSEADPAGTVRSLLGPSASWYVARILEDTPPPAAAVTPGNVRRGRAIAHKTGTSYGFRDAWALGFDQNFTVGVWVGRPDGAPSPGRHGHKTAAPLLYRIFALLPVPDPAPSAPPAGVLIAEHDELPARLRYFPARPALVAGAAELRITFPVDGSTVELARRRGRLAELALVASGGRRPLRWLVNGQPIEARAWRRKAFWPPDGEGLARISVIDSTGQTARVAVWLAGSADAL